MVAKILYNLYNYFTNVHLKYNNEKDSFALFYYDQDDSKLQILEQSKTIVIPCKAKNLP